MIAAPLLKEVKELTNTDESTKTLFDVGVAARAWDKKIMKCSREGRAGRAECQTLVADFKKWKPSKGKEKQKLSVTQVCEWINNGDVKEKELVDLLHQWHRESIMVAFRRYFEEHLENGLLNPYGHHYKGKPAETRRLEEQLKSFFAHNDGIEGLFALRAWLASVRARLHPERANIIALFKRCKIDLMDYELVPDDLLMKFVDLAKEARADGTWKTDVQYKIGLDDQKRKEQEMAEKKPKQKGPCPLCPVPRAKQFILGCMNQDHNGDWQLLCNDCCCRQPGGGCWLHGGPVKHGKPVNAEKLTNKQIEDIKHARWNESGEKNYIYITKFKVRSVVDLLVWKQEERPDGESLSWSKEWWPALVTKVFSKGAECNLKFMTEKEEAKDKGKPEVFSISKHFVRLVSEPAM
eukprot:gene5629-5590_t